MRVLPAAAVAFSLLAVIAASPVHDLSATTVDLSLDPSVAANATSVDTFSVTVERIDELIEDDGSVLAARVVDLVFHFDVDNDKVLVNGRPVDLGVSSIDVESDIIAGERVAMLPDDLIDEAFDVGIAAVEVHADAQRVVLDVSEVADEVAIKEGVDRAALPSAFEVRRVTLQLRVLEINGHKVMQTDMVEQVLDVLPSGKVVKRRPRTVAFADGPIGKMGHRCSQHQRIAALWHRLPHTTRVLIAAFLGSLLMLVFFVALPLAVYVHYKERRPDYDRVRTLEPLMEVDEEDEYGCDEAYTHDEKAALKEPAPAYQ